MHIQNIIYYTQKICFLFCIFPNMFTVIFFFHTAIRQTRHQHNPISYVISWPFKHIQVISPKLPETAPPPPAFRNFLPWHERPAMPTYPGNSSTWCENVVKPTCSHQSRWIWSDMFMGENRYSLGGTYLLNKVLLKDLDSQRRTWLRNILSFGPLSDQSWGPWGQSYRTRDA